MAPSKEGEGSPNQFHQQMKKKRKNFQVQKGIPKDEQGSEKAQSLQNRGRKKKHTPPKKKKQLQMPQRTQEKKKEGLMKGKIRKKRKKQGSNYPPAQPKTPIRKKRGHYCLRRGGKGTNSKKGEEKNKLSSLRCRRKREKRESRLRRRSKKKRAEKGFSDPESRNRSP